MKASNDFRELEGREKAVPLDEVYLLQEIARRAQGLNRVIELTATKKAPAPSLEQRFWYLHLHKSRGVAGPLLAKGESLMEVLKTATKRLKLLHELLDGDWTDRALDIISDQLQEPEELGTPTLSMRAPVPYAPPR